MLIPEPKKVNLKAGSFLLDEGVSIITNKKDTDSLARLLQSEFKERFELTLAGKRKRKKRNIFLEIKNAGSLKPEGYALNIEKDKITITGKDQRGLFYGIQTLLSLAENKGKRVPFLEILDWPDLEIRGVHLTFGANVYKFPLLVKMVKELARHKVNMLILEYEDRFPYESHPLIPAKSAFSKEQIKRIVKIAALYRIELVPLVDSLGHAEKYLTHEEYAHLRELPEQIAEMCPLHPGSLKVVKDLCKDLLPLHPAKYFHIGGDEVFRLGDFCPKCKEYIRRKGKSALFVDYYSKICNWLREKGKVPIIWGDMLIKYPEAIDRFPRDVIVMDWDYSGIDADTTSEVQCGIIKDNLETLPSRTRKTFAPYWRNRYYPKKFKSYPYVRFFMDKGFKVIGASSSNGPYLIPDFHGRYNNNRRFSQRLVSEKALGLMNTFWPSVPVESAWYGLLAGAEYSWNAFAASQEEFDDKFVSSYYGANSKKCKIREGMTQLEKVIYPKENEGIISRDKIKEKRRYADKALSLIKQSKPKIKKNIVNVEYLEIIARIERLLTELELICFDAGSLFVGKNKDTKYFNVDLLPYANRGFINPEINNIRCFPQGRLRFRDVPFKIIKQNKNKDKSCIFLKGTRYYGRQYPKEVKGIEVNSLASRLYFLHTGAYVYKDKKGEIVVEYRINYTDGLTAIKRIINGENIADSYGYGSIPQVKADAFLAWKGDRTGGRPFALVYLICWQNPAPEKMIKSIDFVSAETAVPILIAITGEKRKSKDGKIKVKAERLVSNLHLLKKEFSLLEKRAWICYKKFLLRSDVPLLIKQNFQQENTFEKIDSYVKKLRSGYKKRTPLRR